MGTCCSCYRPPYYQPGYAVLEELKERRERVETENESLKQEISHLLESCHDERFTNSLFEVSTSIG